MELIENRTFDEIKLGDTASLVRTLTHKDIELFAIMSGDINPTHLDDVFAKIWMADGTQAEPADWQFTWDYSGYGLRTGYAGITASSMDGPFEFDVDYILIKAAGLPSIQVSPSAFVKIPAAMTNQPQSQTVMELLPVTFSVGTRGLPWPSCQWYRGDTAITGATNVTYTIPSVAYSDNGAAFKAVVQNVISNVTYAVTSSIVSLTVLADTNAPALVNAPPLSKRELWPCGEGLGAGD